MSTKLHTFISFFNDEIDTEKGEAHINKLIIPMIQRDYAQGRGNDEIKRVRERFLKALYDAVTISPITLDFAYGDIDEEGVLTLLDGQQRLTTLFLLHWYAAMKEDLPIEKYSFLNNFSYQTRPSSRDFCIELVKFKPSFDDIISKEIENQPWFPLEWEKDPTISSMLVVIDAISERFDNVEELWNKLEEGAISFYFQPIQDMGLTDELYIKMNSRGRILTQFEHFKAELNKKLEEADEEIAKRLMDKIDVKWTDMLWDYRNNDNIIDDRFLRYFKFICDIICYKEDKSPQDRSYDEFFLLDEYFDKTNEHFYKNIELFESFFDCWCGLRDFKTPTEFFAKYISDKHEKGKIQITRGDTNIFADCLNKYGEKTGKNRQFPLNKVVLLYVIIVYLLNDDIITEKDFVRRLRVINNLLRNSEDELSDSEGRASGNRMPAILDQVKDIMVKGKIDDSFEKGLNANQLKEEVVKNTWVDNNPDKAELLYKLEDHPLLFGQIGILGVENASLFERFEQLFDCDLDKVDSALMTVGDYSQKEKSSYNYQLGTKNSKSQKAWQDLFHLSSNAGYNNTKQVLIELLEKENGFSNEILETIKKQFLSECEKNKHYSIRYYYVKYDEFRPGKYGKYRWDDKDNKPYEIMILYTPQNKSENSYQPFLYAVDKTDNLSRDNYGMMIIRDNKKIVCENDRYVMKNLDDDRELDSLLIDQNSEGIDVEDRIIKFREYYNSINWEE